MTVRVPSHTVTRTRHAWRERLRHAANSAVVHHPAHLQVGATQLGLRHTKTRTQRIAWPPTDIDIYMPRSTTQREWLAVQTGRTEKRRQNVLNIAKQTTERRTYRYSTWSRGVAPWLCRPACPQPEASKPSFHLWSSRERWSAKGLLSKTENVSGTASSNHSAEHSELLETEKSHSKNN
jgi:hypothetical protein